MTQIPSDLEQTAESYNGVKISYIRGQAAQLEAESLSGLGYSAWFAKYNSVPAKKPDAASDEAVGQEFNKGWFVFHPTRNLTIRY